MAKTEIQDLRIPNASFTILEPNNMDETLSYYLNSDSHQLT